MNFIFSCSTRFLTSERINLRKKCEIASAHRCDSISLGKSGEKLKVLEWFPGGHHI